MNNLPKQNNDSLNSEKYAYLKAEAEKPYKGLRKFIYFGFTASASIGAFIFFLQLIAGKNTTENIYNLLIQLGVIALMIVLFRWENKN